MSQKTIISRKDYMANSCHQVAATDEMRNAAHRAYYAQFVNERTISAVVSHIGASALISSTDKHLNDIPLRRWDVCPVYLAMPMKDADDYLTQAGKVCIAKEAARQWIEKQAAQ